MNGCRIEALVFWSDGVTLTPPGDAAWTLIAPKRRPDAGERLALHRWEQELANGTLSPEEFCRRATELGNGSAAGLLEALPEQIVPIAGMPEVLEELVRRGLSLSLVSAYPRQWLIPALKSGGLEQLFPEQQVWPASEWGGFPQLLDALIESDRITPGRSMWVDHHSLRTKAALARGVDAAVFVHIRQFYRDLGLWGLVPSQRS